MLKRPVALKFLPEGLGREGLRWRVHEMPGLTHLDHIIQIYGNTEDAMSSRVTGAH